MPVETVSPPPPGRPGRTRRQTIMLRRWIIVTVSVVAVVAGGFLVTKSVLAEPVAHKTTETEGPTPSVDATAPSSAGATSSAAASPSAEPTGLSSTKVPVTSSPPPKSTLPGWPGPDNTGVPKGTVLKPSGSILVTKDNTVIDSLDVRGCIQIEARNVTIKRSRIVGSCARGTIGTPLNKKYPRDNVVIEDTEVDGNRKSFDFPVIAYDGFTCRRCNVHGGGTGARLGDRVLIIDSYIHDSNTGEGSHNAAVAGHGDYDVQLIHNWLECHSIGYCSSSVSFYSEGLPVHDVLVEGNHFSGGAYCLYAGATEKSAINIKVRNNTFGTDFQPQCGAYGPAAHWEYNSGNEWSGNKFSNGKAVPAP
ncbi:hypothetical protein F4553_005516 [Allocatelliglobosispora scoriae]|uniref:Right handed beta helix domain-containing protein n=1 Tax=Allocatelliglobosispora scoriae TaxID=643052 RepID=A0A841BZ51_9ACTN|nr:hypothetical protein [Allocatelliglobosispora scoriae]MBB5872082.1 hypothetical protein [Allocatelliglobosispora scoriae]